LNAKNVYSIIRDNNITSQNVARRIGMKKTDTIIKHYYNIDMPHYIYEINKEIK
jgi:RimJ/RimL family protein N-acetyltransferase